MSAFTERLERAARAAGIGETQSEIADSLGISRQRVNKWYKDGLEPNAETILEIAQRWRVNPAWLKSGTGDMHPVIGDNVNQEERELLRNYRSASPKAREIISGMARAARKSMVPLIIGIPGFMSPQPADASIYHNLFSAVRLHIASLRRFWRLIFPDRLLTGIPL